MIKNLMGSSIRVRESYLYLSNVHSIRLDFQSQDSILEFELVDNKIKLGIN